MAGRSLRTRLVVILVCLLAAVSVGIGGITTVALRDFLTDRIDRQLQADAGPQGFPPPERRREWQDLKIPVGMGVGSVIADLQDGRVAEARIQTEARENGGKSIASETVAALGGLVPGAEPRTVDLDQGEYRAIAKQWPDGRVTAFALPLAEVQETVMWMVVAQAGIAGTGLIAAGTTGALMVRRTLRPLRRVAATAAEVSELPLDRGAVTLPVRVPGADTDTRTEVGQVGAALNRMLGHVAAALAARQASETRVRQFVADASHELRTPLAAIRGYAEVARRGRDQVPPDVAHALRRVESESTRMTGLVEDLLLLARLDSGRPLAVASVDLSVLVVDAVSDAHVAGAEHRWQLDLPEQQIAVPGDAARLHQALANLLANARVHTPAGTTVTTSLAVEPDAAVLRVADDGPGIPEELQPEVFERFARGDSSRSRSQGSTGLGLAIVAAVVDAHHGTVSMRSRPGYTVFTVRLPNSTAET